MDFNICATIVDGHKTNTKFYSELGEGGELKISIKNPYNNDEPIFLLYDSVHI